MPTYKAPLRDMNFLINEVLGFLMYSGYVMMAHFWARQAVFAQTFLRNGKGAESAEFYRAKIQTAEFYFDRLLPRADTHHKSALAPKRSLMQMGNADFAFS